MIRKKLKEINKNNSSIGNIDLNDVNKLQKIKNLNLNIHYKKLKKLPKRNLPELKLSKLKSKYDSEIIPNILSVDKSNIINNNNKNISEIFNKKMIINKMKNNSSTKKIGISFPKISNIQKNNLYMKYEIFNNDLNHNHNEHNCSISNDHRNMNYNIISNSHLIINKLQKNIEKDKGNLIKSKKKKIKSISQILSKNKVNLEKFQHQLLLKSLPKSQSSNILFNDSSSLNKIHFENEFTNKLNNISNDNDTKLNNGSIIINNIKSFSTKANKQSFSSKNINFISKEVKVLDNPSEKLNKIGKLLNKISPITNSSLNNKNMMINSLSISSSNPIDISADILKRTFPNFEESITSYYKEFDLNQNILIKGYAYNTSKGNFRNYNEDTITVSKIKLKNDNFFYFFGLYDGHGGNGCSLYLKENLHNFIQEFSVKGLKEAVYKSENEFLQKKAVDEKNNICDSSGSCGIVAIIKNNKLIISNTGDSRIVLYKNGKIFFVTEDHKPCSVKEKERIKNEGGQIYQSPSIIPIYQNGKKIDMPWRVFPGRLSVSRTFGDIKSKNEKFGGKKGVIIPNPDITEFELDNEFDFMVIGCDGIFDVLSNEDLLKIWNIVLREQKDKIIRNKNIEESDEIDISDLCGDFAGLIIKSAMSRDSFDNVSCIVVVFNINFYDKDNINKNTFEIKNKESNINDINE